MGDTDELIRLRSEVVELSKLATLGELSAGMAHEIQNPLNFVINFSKMSLSLLEDLQAALEDEDGLSEDGRSDIEDISASLDTNMKKIREHGERANNIVRDILLYIRGKEDEFIPTDIPRLVKEYLMLSYHSSRASDKSFNVSFVEDYDDGLDAVEIIPQDFGRAVLNIFNNSFYAMKERASQGEADYHPTITVSVKNEGDKFRVIMEDNGTGMTEEVRNSVFKNYFTTKPVGKGTGLGLILTKRIIEEKHHGTIMLESCAGGFTRFSFTIPMEITNQNR